MGEKGMESTGPVGTGSAATAVGGGGIEQMKPSGGIGSMGDALAGQSKMSDETLGGGGGGGISDMLKSTSSSSTDELKKP